MPAEVKKAAHGPADYGGHGTRRQRVRPAECFCHRKGHKAQEAEADKAGISCHLEELVMHEMGRRSVGGMKVK